MRDDQLVVMSPSVINASPSAKLTSTDLSMGISPEPVPTCSTQSISTDVSTKLSVKDMLRRDSEDSLITQATLKSTTKNVAYAECNDAEFKDCAKDENDPEDSPKLSAHDSEVLEDLEVQNHSAKQKENRCLVFDDETSLENNNTNTNTNNDFNGTTTATNTSGVATTQVRTSHEAANTTFTGTHTPSLVQNIGNTLEVQRDSLSETELLAPFRRASSLQNLIDISAESANINSFSVNQNQPSSNVPYPKQKFVFNNCTLNYNK